MISYNIIDLKKNQIILLKYIKNEYEDVVQEFIIFYCNET